MTQMKTPKEMSIKEIIVGIVRTVVLKGIAQEKGKEEGVVVETKEVEAEKDVVEVEIDVAEVRAEEVEVRAEEAEVEIEIDEGGQEVNNVIDPDQEKGIGDQGPETEDLGLDHNLLVEKVEVGIERVNIIENQRRRAPKLR